MSINNLIETIPPPPEPTYAYDEAWEDLQGQIGTQLPFDYKELMRLYGAGSFLGFFEICGPRSPTNEGRITNFQAAARSTFIHVLQGSWIIDDPPLPIWPRPGGMLAFGQTRDADLLFWLTRGAVDEWPIVLWDSVEAVAETFEHDLTDFLAGMAGGTIQSEILRGRSRQPDRGAGFEEASRPWPTPWKQVDDPA